METTSFFQNWNPINQVDENPFLCQACSFVMGMSVSYMLWSFSFVPLYFIASLLCGVYLIYLLWQLKEHSNRFFDVSAALTFLFSFLFGFFLFQARCRQIAEISLRPSACYSATVDANPTEGKRTWRVPTHLTDGSKIQLLILKQGLADDLLDSLRVGATIEFSCWQVVETNPQVTRQWEGRQKTFKPYYDYLFSHGYSAVCFVNPSFVSVKDLNIGGGIKDRLTVLRAQILAYYRQRLPETQATAVIEAVTLGEKSHLTSSLRSSFSQAGMSHLLALSGFHLGVLVMLIRVVFFTSQIRLWYKIVNFFIVIPSLWAYTLLVGCPPSLVRAAVMCTLFLIGEQMNRDSSQLQLLALALVIMLCTDPLLLLDLGMQLSYLAVLGIILLGEPLCRSLRHSRKFVRIPLDIVLISLSCTLYTAPLVALRFGYLPLYSVLSNLLSSFLSVALMWVSALWWIVTPIEALQQMLTPILLHLSQWLCRVSDMICQLPGATVPFQISNLGAIAFYVFIAVITVMVVRSLPQKRYQRFYWTDNTRF